MMVEGPPGFWDYLLVVSALIVLAMAGALFVRYLVRPREKEDDHIKRKILDDEPPSPGEKK